jgi:hypothetical protein
MRKQFISILSIFLLVVSIISISTIQAEKYVNWDGREISEKQYQQRLNYCSIMAFTTDKISHVTVPCADWVLTYEGDMMIADYIVEKHFKP